MPMIDQLVRQAEVLNFSVKQMQQNAQGILTIGANTESMLFFIPEFKKRLAALHPNISLFVKEIDSYQIETELTDGTVLIGMAFFDTLSDQRLRMANLINEKPIVLLNRNHHLAGKGGVSIKELRNEDFVFTRRAIAPRLFDGLGRFLSGSWRLHAENYPRGRIQPAPNGICELRAGYSFSPGILQTVDA